MHSDNVRVIEFTNRLQLTGVTVTGGSASSGGGLLTGTYPYFNAGDLFLNESTISGNFASSRGGGINISAPYGGGLVSVTGSTISGNVSNGLGGGFNGYARDTSFTFRDSTISGNTTVSYTHLTLPTKA